MASSPLRYSNVIEPSSNNSAEPLRVTSSILSKPAHVWRPLRAVAEIEAGLQGAKGNLAMVVGPDEDRGGSTEVEIAAIP